MNAEDYRAERDNALAVLANMANTSKLLATEYKQAFDEITGLRGDVETLTDQIRSLELANTALKGINADLEKRIAQLQLQRDTWRAVSGQ